MESIIPTSDYREVEGRLYLNPEVALNESNQFINNLRNTQGQQNQEIAQQTYNLGTDLPSSQGGLGTNNTGMSYFTSRYQVPQTNSAVADLRATAQAAALNQILANEQAIWKKRYNDAYRKYQTRHNNSSTTGGGGDGNSSTWQGDIKKESTDGDGEGEGGGEGEGEGNKTTTPPNPDDYYIDGEEQTKRIQERTGGWMPDWLVNILKIMG